MTKRDKIILGVFAALLLVSFAPTTYRLISFAAGTANDTAYTPGSIRVNGVARFPTYGSADTNKVLGVGANGVLALRTKITTASASQNIANTALTWNGTYLQNLSTESIVWDSITAWSMNTISGNTQLFMDNEGVGIRHLKGTTSPPTIAAGTGAGLGATASIVSGSTDLSGGIVIVTGTSCATASNVAVITFNSPYATQPKFVAIFPANAATVSLVVTKQCYIDQASGANTTTFTISSNSSPLADATTYQWRYLVIQ